MEKTCLTRPASCASSLDFSSDEDLDDDVEPSVTCNPMRDTTSANLPQTQKKRLVKYYGVHRDKESLLEELLSLQDALQDQMYHFKAHKKHHNALKEENSRLEKKIEYLETSGLEAALTGSLTKLRSKLKGCKARIMELESICSTNTAEIRSLRVDTQYMRTQEVIVERDLFAQEVRRLQRCAFHLGKLHKKVSGENKEAVRLKAKITMLTAKNPALETSVELQQKTLENMTKEAEEWSAKGAAAKKACARDYEKFKTLQEESKTIMHELFKEKLQKAELTTNINSVSHQVRLAEKENREKARAAAGKSWFS